jgi:hypothetical protein
MFPPFKIAYPGYQPVVRPIVVGVNKIIITMIINKVIHVLLFRNAVCVKKGIKKLFFFGMLLLDLAP